MRKLFHYTKIITLLFLIAAPFATIIGQIISDTNIYAIYDEDNHNFRIYYDGDDRIIIKKQDVDAIGIIKFNDKNDTDIYVFDKYSCKETFDAELNNGVGLLTYYTKNLNTSPCYMQIKLEEKPKDITEKAIAEQQTDTNLEKTVLYQYIAIAALFVVILVLIIIIVVIKKRKNRKPGDANSDNNVITVVEEIAVDKKKGLQHVYQNINDYYAINMNEFFDDTAIKTVYFSRKIISDLNSHFKDFLENSERTKETGCYLLGCWDYHNNSNLYDISIEYIVAPGKDAVFDEYTLNFGHEIGVLSSTMIDDLVEKTKQDYVLTSWMHSHPGSGLFLSSHDLIVQKLLANSDEPNRLLAIVIDTNSPNWSMALFAPKKDGKMNNKNELKKTVSFDDLLLWSRKLVVNQMSNAGFFTLDIGLAGLNTVNFSAKSINQMDDVIYANENGISGYFDGSRIGNDIFVDKCLQDNDVDTLGCFIITSHTQGDGIPIGLKAIVDVFDFAIICCNGTKMSLYVKTDDGLQKCSKCDRNFMEYKEWTRRKRI